MHHLMVIVIRAAVFVANSLLAGIFLALLVLRLRIKLARRLRGRHRTIGFLHPYCNDGGGGERVLWVAVRELIKQQATDQPGWKVVVYTGDSETDGAIREHVMSRFGVQVSEDVEFVRLSLRSWIEARRYPVATLMFQAAGSVLLAAEAVWRAPPDAIVDTTGLAFSFPLLLAAGVSRIATYVHYPIVSSDMLNAVRHRREAHNNSGRLARSRVGTNLKLAYYKLLATLYART